MADPLAMTRSAAIIEMRRALLLSLERATLSRAGAHGAGMLQPRARVSRRVSDQW